MEDSYYLQGEFQTQHVLFFGDGKRGCQHFWGFSKAPPEKSWCTDVASSMKISQHGNLIEVDCNSSLDWLGHLVRCGKECCMVSPSPGPGVGGSVFQKDCWLQLICFGRFGYCPVLLIYSSIQFEPRVPLSFFLRQEVLLSTGSFGNKSRIYMYIDIDTYIINYVCIHIYICIYIYIYIVPEQGRLSLFLGNFQSLHLSLWTICQGTSLKHRFLQRFKHVSNRHVSV